MKRNGFPGSRGERGQVMILASVALTAMLAILALVIDLGYLYAERRSEQRAADAAAWAGALALPIVGEAKARSDALYFAQVNGFTNDATTTVTVNIPPISPPAKQAYDSTYVEVIITRQVETFFAKVLSRFNTSATAYAIAASNQWVNYTLFVIDKTASPALSLGNSTVLHVNGGSIAVNSSAGGSYGAINNNGTLVASNRIDSVGTYTGSGTASPAPTRISVPIADPFATTPRPYYDATYKIYRMPDGTPLVDRSGSYNTANTVNPTSNVTLYPGTYWGGFRLNSSSVTVQLQPGLYVMAGGGSGGGFYANGGTVQG
ncbi:MAG: hypothetical protein HYY30_01580, partial [Chloroflexi bacterium]|nr:hypothetical protein [Chloroflexota bacterium]